MQKLLTLVLTAFFIVQSFAQKTATQSWQEDIRFLQETVHQDYPFLFDKITAKEWDGQVEHFLSTIPQLQEHERVAGLARLIAAFGYGHTRMRLGDYMDYHRIPVNLYHYSDGIFIQGIHKDYADMIGAKVVEVEGIPVDKALAMVRPVVPVENEQFFKAYGLSYLCIPEILHAQGVTSDLKDQINMTLVKNDKEIDYSFSAINIQELDMPVQYSHIIQGGEWVENRDQDTLPLYLKHLDKIYYWQYLPKQKAVYVRQSQIQDDPSRAIPEFYEEVFDYIENNDVEKLIIDVRLNGGGNNYKNKPVITGIIKSEKINQVGNLFVIIGRRTFSACQNLVNELDNYTNAIFVGEPTSENINFYGDNRRVELPNLQKPVYLSFAWWQDKPQWENGPWLPPHIAVELSSEDYLKGRDPVLETVFSFSDDDLILDPMEYLTGLFESGQIDKVQMEAKRLANDSRYKFFDFESQFNRAGYQLLDGKRNQEALFVFQMVTDLYPQSANAWDSLAEALWKSGDLEKAKTLYQKAIDLDPDGEIGAHAREMLKEMKN